VRSLARLGRIVEQTGQHAGVSLAQYRLLLFVAREPQRAGELATRAAVSRPTLTNLVNTLERDGFIRRERLAADRRGIRLEVTEAGAAALAEAEHILIGRLGELLDDVDDVERILCAFADLDAALDREVERFLQAPEAERADR
jgi:DNA-binding MarR family transcriptional regulator